MLAQSALVSTEQLSQISLVGLMQVGKPGVTLARVCANTLEQLVEEIREKGLFNPEICPHCGTPLGEEPCGMCQQRKCWSCEGETAGLLKICVSCLHQYNTSVLSHLADPHAASKRWCDSCQDWMPVPHQHKSPCVAILGIRAIGDAASALDVPLYLHPNPPSRAVQDAYYAGFDPAVSASFATFGWGWHLDTGIHALRIVLGGVFDRYPGLQLVLGHWGEIIPFYLDRFAQVFTQVADSCSGL